MRCGEGKQDGVFSRSHVARGSPKASVIWGSEPDASAPPATPEQDRFPARAGIRLWGLKGFTSLCTH